MKRALLYIIIIVLIAVVIWKMNSNNTSDTSFDQNTPVVRTDTIQPSITCIEPKAEAVDVAVDANVKLCFSEAVKVDATSYGNLIMLQDSDGMTVPAKASYNTADNSYVIDPDASLIAKTIYTLRVKSSVADMEGNELDAPVKLEFTTK